MNITGADALVVDHFVEYVKDELNIDWPSRAEREIARALISAVEAFQKGWEARYVKHHE